MTANRPQPDQAAMAVGDAWEALIVGKPDDDPEVTAVLCRVLEDLAALDRGAPLSLAHRARIWQEVLTTAPPTITLPASRPAALNGHRPEMTLPVTPLRARSSRLLAALSIPILLALVVAVMVLVGKAELQRSAPRVGDPTVLPAISGTLSPPATVTTRTLLNLSVANLPSGSPRVVVDRWRLQPSTTDVVLPANKGAVILTVDVGNIIVRVDGAEHRLAPGDVVDVAGHEFAFRAPDPVPAVAYIVSITPELSTEGGQSHSRIWISGDHLLHAMDFVLGSSADDFPGGQGQMVLQEVIIPPGSALPPQMTQPFVWTEVGTGVLGLTLEGEHLPFRWKPGTERKFRYGDYFPYLRPGTRMEMRNAGDTPLVLYRLTLEPDGRGKVSS